MSIFEGGLGRRSLEDGKYDEVNNTEEVNNKTNFKEIDGKKIFKAAVVETTELARAQARNVADRYMSETKEDREAPWFKRTVKRIWKGNLAKEVIRSKKEHRARKEILDSGNLYVDQLKDTDIHKQAMDSVLERFISEYEEDTLKEEERKSKQEVADESIKEELKNAIKHFAGEPTMTKEAFEAETDRILKRADKGYKEKGKMYANNLFDIATEVRDAVTHGEKLNEFDFDLELTLGKAEESLHTKERLNNFQRALEKISSTRVGAALVNETTVGIAATAYLITSKAGTSVARQAITLGTFGAGVALSGGIAASKESFRLKKERAQHIRESAMGMKFEENDMVRRQEMEKNRYETRGSKEIIEKLQADLAKVQKGEVPENELNEILANLSDVEARINLGNKEKIDLVGYSNFSELEKERTAIELGRARLKAALQKAQTENTIQFKNGDPKQQLEKITETIISKLSLETAEKDRIFTKMKKKRVAKKFLQTIFIGGTIGIATQEIAAFFQGKTDNIFEGAFKPSEHLAKKATALEGLRRWISGDGPRIPFGQGHEVLFGGTHLQLPEGTDLITNPDGTSSIMHGNEVVLDHVKLGLDPNGNLDVASVKALAHEGIFTDFSQTGGKITEHITTTPNEYVNKHPDLTEQIHRTHMDNDTPMYPDPDRPGHLLGADKNELKLEWGGKGGTGINENGDFEFQVQHMTDDGSYHNGLSVAAHEQMKKGGLDVLLSVTRGTQHMVIPVHVDEFGKAVISHTSETGKMLFENQNGHAIFEGAYAEVGHESGIATDGGHNMDILATHIGTDHANNITETVIKDTTISNVKFNIPDSWTTVPPPFVPFVPRRSLESEGIKKEEGNNNQNTKTIEQPTSTTNEEEIILGPAGPWYGKEEKQQKKVKKISQKEYDGMRDDINMLNKKRQGSEGIVTVTENDFKSEYGRKRYNELNHIQEGVPVTFNKEELLAIGDEIENTLSNSKIVNEKNYELEMQELRRNLKNAEKAQNEEEVLKIENAIRTLEREMQEPKVETEDIPKKEAVTKPERVPMDATPVLEEKNTVLDQNINEINSDKGKIVSSGNTSETTETNFELKDLFKNGTEFKSANGSYKITKLYNKGLFNTLGKQKVEVIYKDENGKETLVSYTKQDLEKEFQKGNIKITKAGK